MTSRCSRIRGSRLPAPVAAWFALAMLTALPASAQNAAGPVSAPGVRWEELTVQAFVRAVERAASTAVLPLGIIEKHGPQLPLGTDLINVRELALRAAAQEYAIVFPPYFVGQIFEARHQPGTIAYSERLMWDLLQETLDEIARNGVRKIILVNGHGGNTNFLTFFCQAQLARRRDYAVFLYQPSRDPETDAAVQTLRKTDMEMHGGEMETSTMLAHRPDLVDLERAGDQSGADQARLAGLDNVYTAIWWYARFPNHYAGDARPANRALGEFLLDRNAKRLAATIKAVKEDMRTLDLQQQFFTGAEQPSKTPQRP